MNVFDYNPIKLMMDSISEFENEKIDLCALIKTLYRLIESLQNLNSQWQDSLQSEWWTLEEIYSVAVDRGEIVLDIEGENLVREAIENMKSLLNEYSKQLS
jgi:hypothetical protein